MIGHQHTRGGFIERTLASLIAIAEYSANAEALVERGGVLQRVDPRVKLAGLLALIVAVAASRRLAVIGFVFAASLLLGLLSGIRLGMLAGLIWVPVLLFSGVLAVPALFLTPGPEWAPYITYPGIRAAAFLISRGGTAATISAVLVLTTPWPHLLKALRSLGLPVVLVVILGMTYRYIFAILQTALDMFESRKSRTVGTFAPNERRRIATAVVGALLSRSFQMSNDVHQAMLSRGFRGEVYLLDDFTATRADWCWAGLFAGSAALAFWLGR